nr:SLOG family protein [uncultured Oscillibacter sp.]
MRKQTCCFTGHRTIPPGKRRELARRLEETVLRLYRRGVRYFGAGGALGFDTLAAQAVLSLREECPGIRLILVLPCPSQTKGWKPEDAAEYERIKSRADKVVYTSQEYTQGCMYKRNRHLVDHSGVCVCYLTKDSGGTAYTVRYARTHGLEIINLAYR